MQSAHSFAKSHNLSKTSVLRRAKQLGYDTSDGLSEDAIKALEQHYGLSEIPKFSGLAIRANTEEISFTEFMNNLGEEIEVVNAEFVEESEDGYIVAKNLSEEDSAIEDARDLLNKLNAQRRAARHHQEDLQTYSQERRRLQQRDLMDTAKRLKKGAKKS